MPTWNRLWLQCKHIVLKRVTIIGAGAAGCFLAQRLHDLCPELSVTLLEAQERPLRKVAVTGGGRCNLTNSFALVDDLCWVYPRGHRLMKRLLRSWSQHDTMNWFEGRGVPLVTQEDECVFPLSQRAQDIVEVLRKGLDIRTSCKVHLADYLQQKEEDEVLVITTGGTHDFSFLDALHPKIERPIPSLFPFRLSPTGLESLMGIVVENAVVSLAGTKFRAEGTLLITHFGVSGPAILRLSSYAARYLHENNYKARLCIRWCEADGLMSLTRRHREFLLHRAQIPSDANLQYLNSKQTNRLSSVLTSDIYEITSRAPHKEEFVTCGGVALSEIEPSTMRYKKNPTVYFAGEVLDVDGVTGGFNLQAAWSMAEAVARSISDDL